MGGFFMGTELNQALVQQALSFAPETTEERQAVKVSPQPPDGADHLL